MISSFWIRFILCIVSSKQYTSRGSLSQSPAIKASRPITEALCRISAYFYAKFLSPSSCLRIFKPARKGDVQDVRTVNLGRHVMAAHDVKSDKNCLLQGSTAMLVGLSKFGIVSGKKFGEPIDDSLCLLF